MFNVDSTKLNPLDKKILDTLTDHAKENQAPTITEAAKLCDCSVSQISKAIKKAGFVGYKKFISYLYLGETTSKKTLDELERLKLVLQDFDPALVGQFADLLLSHKRIILFGYGPSLIVGQYFEYKLRLEVRASIATPPDEQSVCNMVDSNSLLVILTTTGQYRSFEELFHRAKDQGSDVVVISEEFNSLVMENCDRYFVLTNHRQPDTLKPHEKTRTVFFIFIEQVIHAIRGSLLGR